MAEHPDVILVRRGYDAFSTGDVAPLSETIAGHATQYQPGRSALAGDHRGLQAILEFNGRQSSKTNGTFRVELGRLFTEGQGRVVATHRATGERAGRRLDTGASLNFTVIDGTARDIHGCQEDIDAWDEFWA